jgi:CYTH domain-containing protein
MNLERERKFLVRPDMLPKLLLENKRRIITGYFTTGGVAIRVSQVQGGERDGRSKICFKGPGTEERAEYEYDVPRDDADGLLALAPTSLTKFRYDYQGWEIDEIFLPRPNQYTKTLWVAEWEEHPGKPPIPDPLPAWIGLDVTADSSYKNSALAFEYGRKADYKW